MRDEPRSFAACSWPDIPDLPVELERLLQQVPAGAVTTFGDLAFALGDRSAARWVATQLAAWRNESHGSTDRPWYRVVRRDGDLAAGTPEQRQRQATLLTREGVVVTPELRPAVPSTWTAFTSTVPLRHLAQWQISAAGLARTDLPMAVPGVVAAIDLSYITPQEAIAAYVAYDVVQGRVITTETLRSPVPFPYITGYLTFREVPAMCQLLQRVGEQGQLAPVVLVDGSGRLHPRRFGIAVAVGLMSGCSTIGVSKHRLLGRSQPGDPPSLDQALWDHEELLGYRLQRYPQSSPSLYVSPGTGIDVESARQIVRAVWRNERLPVPQYLADKLSRQEAQALRITEAG